MKIKSSSVVFSIAFFGILARSEIRAQENHYWTSQFGPTSTFLGGAVTGGVRDNSLIFYNPGAAAFTSGFNLSLQSDAVYNQNVYIENGAGSGINLHQNRFESSPQLFGVTFGPKNKPSNRISFGWLTTAYSNIRLRARNEVFTDIIPQSAGDELYVGSWTYGNRVREDWYGLGFSKKIKSNLGIGFTAFTTFRSYEFSESQDQNVLVVDPSNADEYSSVRYVVASNNLDGSAVGLLLKLGVAYEKAGYKFGITVTTPRAQLDYFGSMSLNSSIYSDLAISDSSLAGKITNYSIQFNNAKSTYKSPWIIDLGLMKNFFNTDIYLRVGYFGSVPIYRLVEPTDDNFISKSIYENNEVGKPFLSQKTTWNFAIGWNRKITEKYTLMAGFRTDFNYLDKDAIDKSGGFAPEISNWNLYHLSAGTDLTILKHNFTLGLTYTYGKSNNQAQFVNLDVPEQNEIVVGKAVQNIANAHIDQFSLTIGYIYNFN
jgi:hypothetical protein